LARTEPVGGGSRAEIRFDALARQTVTQLTCDTASVVSDRVLPIGKVSAALLQRLLDGIGPLPPEVLVGPGIGEDACAIQVGPGVLVAASDPITLTGADLGRTAIAVNANDIAVTGVRPRWFLATVLLPAGSTERELERLFGDMRRALSELGAVLVGGHTEVTDVVSAPVVAGHMLGLAPAGRIVTTGGVRPGDAVVQVGRVPIEGAAALAHEHAAAVASAPRASVEAAAAALDAPGISVVEAALAAAELGATAMHDPTEGGIAAALWELATAARVALRVDRDRIAWFAPGVDVCRAAGADPWATLASGALLATFPRPVAGDAVERLTASGHDAVVIGRAEPGEGVRDTEGRPIPWPDRDEVARLLAASTTGP
jgi:hydrogenase expression/formation protein HypE